MYGRWAEKFEFSLFARVLFLGWILRTLSRLVPQTEIVLTSQMGVIFGTVFLTFAVSTYTVPQLVGPVSSTTTALLLLLGLLLYVTVGVCELATANWLSALPHPSVPGNGRNSRVVEKLRTGYRLVCVPAFVIALCAQVMMGAAHTLVLLLGALFCTYLACFHDVVVGKPPTIFALLSPMDALISTVIVSIVTLLLGPWVWQFVLDFGYVPGLQINHIALLMLWSFYIMTILWSGLAIVAFQRERERRRSQMVSSAIGRLPLHSATLSIFICAKMFLPFLCTLLGGYVWCWSTKTLFLKYPVPFMATISFSAVVMVFDLSYSTLFDIQMAPTNWRTWQGVMVCCLGIGNTLSRSMMRMGEPLVDERVMVAVCFCLSIANGGWMYARKLVPKKQVQVSEMTVTPTKRRLSGDRSVQSSPFNV